MSACDRIEAGGFIDLGFCRVEFEVKSLEVNVLVSEIVYPTVPSLLVVLLIEREYRAERDLIEIIL